MSVEASEMGPRELTVAEASPSERARVRRVRARLERRGFLVLRGRPRSRGAGGAMVVDALRSVPVAGFELDLGLGDLERFADEHPIR